MSSLPSLAPVRLSRKELQQHYDGFVRSLRKSPAETRGTYERALREFVRWHGEDRHCKFLKDDIVRYRSYLIDERHLSAVSISTYLTALRRFCEYLRANRVLHDNPAKAVAGSPRPTAHTRDPLSPDEVGLLFDALRPIDEMGLRDAAFIKLMIFCGLSEIEIARANMADLKLDGPQCSLSVQGKGKVVKDAVVELPKEVKEVLGQYLTVRPSASGSEPLFASAGNRTRGFRMTTRGIRERVNHFLEIAGVKKGALRRITPFSLRHTAALMMAQSGASVDEIQKRMRLGSVMTTLLYMNHKRSNDNGGTQPRSRTRSTSSTHGIPISND